MTLLTDRLAAAEVGRKRYGGFGAQTGNKLTFVHRDCQRQPSTHPGHCAVLAIFLKAAIRIMHKKCYGATPNRGS